MERSTGLYGSVRQVGIVAYVCFFALADFICALYRMVDGEPSNNDYFGTQFEWDPSTTQLRHGGDIKGLVQDRVLDWIYGMF